MHLAFPALEDTSHTIIFGIRSIEAISLRQIIEELWMQRSLYYSPTHSLAEIVYLNHPSLPSQSPSYYNNRQAVVMHSTIPTDESPQNSVRFHYWKSRTQMSVSHVPERMPPFSTI